MRNASGAFLIRAVALVLCVIMEHDRLAVAVVEVDSPLHYSDRQAQFQRGLCDQPTRLPLVAEYVHGTPLDMHRVWSAAHTLVMLRGSVGRRYFEGNPAPLPTFVKQCQKFRLHLVKDRLPGHVKFCFLKMFHDKFAFRLIKSPRRFRRRHNKTSNQK